MKTLIMKTSRHRRTFIKQAALGTAAILGSDRCLLQAQTPVRRTGGPKLKLSLNAYSFSGALNSYLKDSSTGLSLFDLLEFCAEHNFDAIDPTGYFFPGYPEVPSDAYINEFKRRAFQLGLDISGTGVRNNFASPDQEKRASDVRLVQAWIEVAAKMGAPVIRVFAGAEPEGYSREQVLSWMVKDLKACVAHGKRHGVMVGVQNHGDFLLTSEQTLEVVERVNSEWFGVIVDTGNFATEDPYEAIARVLPHAVNWQVKESPFGKDSKIRTDLKKLVRIIRAGGYRGYLPIETLELKDRPYDPKVLVPRFLKELQDAMDQTV